MKKSLAIIALAFGMIAGSTSASAWWYGGYGTRVYVGPGYNHGYYGHRYWGGPYYYRPYYRTYYRGYYNGCRWLPGHYDYYGYWIPGHRACW